MLGAARKLSHIEGCASVEDKVVHMAQEVHGLEKSTQSLLKALNLDQVPTISRRSRIGPGAGGSVMGVAGAPPPSCPLPLCLCLSSFLPFPLLTGTPGDTHQRSFAGPLSLFHPPPPSLALPPFLSLANPPPPLRLPRPLSRHKTVPTVRPSDVPWPPQGS
jgi:hypothetical protein